MFVRCFIDFKGTSQPLIYALGKDKVKLFHPFDK